VSVDRPRTTNLAPVIRVNAIAAGSVVTKAEDVAAAVVHLASRAGRFVTGKLLEVDGGLQQPNLDLRIPDLS
jgi:hypothetical protein